MAWHYGYCKFRDEWLLEMLLKSAVCHKKLLSSVLAYYLQLVV